MNNKSIIILISSFYDFSKASLNIGGVQTYIKDLARLCFSLGYKTTVIQYSKRSNEDKMVDFNGISIIDMPLKSTPQALYNDIRRKYPNAYIIIATDQLTIKDKNKKTLQIQHGIAFDIPEEFITGFWRKSKWLIHLNKLLRCIKNVGRLYQVPNTICVDYNFYNWFRTLGLIESNNYVRVIPNYASAMISQSELENKLSHYNGVRNIIFARRFVDYRGTKLFADVALRLLAKYPNINITFAGSGPLEQGLRSMFANNSRIKITSFTADESIKVQSTFDIAVVPTIYSEGTSLSLLEAMAAGCFVIATHVGGMTNIILDGFNGILSYPDSDSVFKSIERIINMPKDEFTTIVKEGYKSTVMAFSLGHWRKKWTQVLNDWTNA